MNTKVLRDLSYGVYLVTAMDGQRPTGCVANSIMQITSEPATLAVSLNHDNFTNLCVAKEGRFAVHILAQDSPSELIGRFGFQSGRTAEKFEGLSYTMRNGAPVLDEGTGWLVCRVVDRLETATHTVFLAQVEDADQSKAGVPMTYAYYHGVVKGKSPKNAPTYQPEDPAPTGVWKCSVCGYIYDGPVPFEQLGEDYRCPVCHQPKSVFRKE